LDGILYVSIIEGSFTTETFTEFIDGLLDKMNPFPGPNSVIVMDNCRIHKADKIRKMIEERCVFLDQQYLTSANTIVQWYALCLPSAVLAPL
jgi:hypothetical protein